MTEEIAITEAAKILGVTTDCLYKRNKQGKLYINFVSYKIRTVLLDDINKIKSEQIPKGTKKCNLCKEVKKNEYFYEGKTCLLCYPQYYKNRRLKNPEKFREYEHTKYKRHGSKIKDRASKWYYNNQERAKERIMENYLENKEEINMKIQLKKYNLTEQQLIAMKKESNNKCKICDLDMKKICIDHDHSTGRVRGLICNKCNSALGFFNDDINILYKAYKYLRDHESNNENLDYYGKLRQI